MQRSHLELLFEEQVRTARLPKPERNYRFLKDRKFELDFAWLIERVALEIEGGIFSGGAHGRGTGIVRDIEKSNLALLSEPSWRVFRATGDMVNDGRALALVRAALLAAPTSVILGRTGSSISRT